MSDSRPPIRATGGNTREKSEDKVDPVLTCDSGIVEKAQQPAGRSFRKALAANRLHT